MVSRLFARRGTDETSDRVSLTDLGLEHPDRHPYIPSAWWVLRWLLPTSAVRPDDVFVEFGCGKGRILIDAARRYRFARVIGVELSEELSGIARELIAKERRLRCPDVRVENVDATTFEIPDDMTHAYMFNPFMGETFRQVLQNVAESLDRRPRRFQLIYVNPENHDDVMATGRFRVVRMVHTTRLVSTVRAGIYEAL